MRALLPLILLSSAAVLSAQSYVIPSGTSIDVRTIDSIELDRDHLDKRFAGSVARDITDQNGNVIVRRGANADLRLMDMGDQTYSVQLAGVEMNGRMVPINMNTDYTAENDQRSGIGKNKRTGKYVGGGAALGAAIGAIAGGGKGAALGAILGGAGGAGAQVMTRGKDTTIPSETVISYRLDRSVNLNTTSGGYYDRRDRDQYNNGRRDRMMNDNDRYNRDRNRDRRNNDPNNDRP